METLMVIYSRTEIEFRVVSNNDSFLNCPSFKKPENFTALVTSTNDKICYNISYSKIDNKKYNFSSIEEIRTHYKANKDFYKSFALEFNIEKIEFDFQETLQFGTELQELNENPFFKGYSLTEKFKNFHKMYR